MAEEGPVPEVCNNVPLLLTSNQTAWEMVSPFAPVPVKVILCHPAESPEGICAVPESKLLLKVPDAIVCGLDRTTRVQAELL